MQTYNNAEEFVNALKAGQLSQSELTVEGMVKPLIEPMPGGPSHGAFLFSPGTTCALWIPVPDSVIEKIDHIGTVTCKDHQHEYVRLHLKLPHTPERPFFAKLLGHFQQSAALSGMAAGAASLNSAFAGHGAGDFGIANFASPAAFGWNPPHPHIHWKPLCAACIAGNMALAAAIGAAIAAAAPELLASPGAVTWLAGQFGISTTAAAAALSGVGGAALAKILCGNKC
ncbi:MAG TPA: hypothetical protein VH643_21200 [Gemmataceae bacterium]|jgi:hypothetical protein